MTPVPVEEITRRRAEILAAIGQAARRRGRDPGAVALMAVTKTQPAETVANAARAGIVLFGENRVQEAAAKIDAVKDAFPRLEWRLIGPLQTNKAKTALQYFQAVESVDRERLAVRLEALLAGESRVLPVLLEINLGAEESKSGASPAEAEGLAHAVLACPHLLLSGLMAVPPFHTDPQKARPHFAALRELRDRLAERLSRPLPELSMGMSHDFSVAVEEGATEVRIGTALFGARETV
ncbi:MAG: YggS family pyridoxal phosphate-dependent enzyme [Thermoanaerobaculia bacterium]